MASIRFFITTKKMDLAAVKVRIVVSGVADLTAVTGETVMRDTWDNKRGRFRDDITLSEYDNELLDRLHFMKRYILDQYRQHPAELSKAWFTAVIQRFRDEYIKQV